jgi:Na+-driven multidrug efflux pump
MGEPSQAKTLLQLAWPLVISFTFRSILTAIDLPYASFLENPDAAIAAIGLSFALDFSFIACWVGTSAALTSYLSKAIGEGSEVRVRQLKRTTAKIVGFLAVLFILLGAAIYWFAEPVLGGDVDAAVIDNFRIYASVLMVGVALLGFWSTIPDSVVKAHHDTKSTMIAGLISGLSNVVLNTLFMFVFDLGIFGIALATALARAGSLAYALHRAGKLEAARRAAWAEMPPKQPRKMPGVNAAGEYTRPYAAMLTLAVPSALTFVLMGTENGLVNWVLSSFADPTAAIAAYAIYHRAVLLAIMPTVAVGVAVLPFMARHLGEGNLAEVTRGLRQAYLFGFLFAALGVFPTCWFAAEPLAHFLSKSEATRSLAAFAIRYAVPLGALVAIPFLVCRPAFEAVQRGGPGLSMAVLRYLFLSVPLALLGAHLCEGSGRDPFYGLIFGLLIGTAVVSVVFTLWLVRMVGGLQEPRAAA